MGFLHLISMPLSIQWDGLLFCRPCLIAWARRVAGYNYLGLGIMILVCYGVIHSIIWPPKIERIKYLLPLLFMY